MESTEQGQARPSRTDAGRRRQVRPAVLLGLLAMVVAAALPLSALLLAGRWATGEVTASTIAGERSTATAVGQQADQSYRDALAVFAAGVGRPSLLAGLDSSDVAVAEVSLGNLRMSAPFYDVGLFGATRRPVAEVPAGSAPLPAAAAVSGGTVVQGPVREIGSRSLRAVTAPITASGGEVLGYLTADIDLGRLIPDGGALRFARTGTNTVVGTDARVLSDADPALVGVYLKTPAIARLARAHRPGTLTITTVLTHRHIVLVYEPVAGRPWGVLTAQDTAEAFAAVGGLTHRLRLLAAVFAALGLLLAGAVTAMLATRDRRITAQTTALAAAQETFHSAFDNAPTGVALVDLDGCFRQVNRSLCELTGYTEAELLGRTIVEITHPDDRARDAAVLAERRAGDRETVFLEKRYLRADGQLVWVSIRSSAVADAHGRPDHIISHITDISELRAAAIARSEANIELAAARDAAVAATTAKTTFLATMSHEIRTPMNAVIGMTGLLLDTALDEEQRQFTETVRSSGEALLAIVNEILDFSKIEAGDLELEMSPFDVRECVETALDLVAFTAETKGLELVAELAADCPALVSGDVTRFRQVVVNLVGNAVKFTETGVVHVRVSGQALGEGRDRLTVAVRDSGIGIPVDRMDRLFQPFRQADSSTTRTHGGTGLGLVISRRLAVAMGGDIEVTSEAGIGSTFTFTAVVETAPERRAETTTDQPMVVGAAVLLVEHDALSRHATAELLRSWAVSVTEVSSAAAALDAISTGQPYAAVVLDLDLPDTPDQPGTGGAGLAAAMLARSGEAPPPLILLAPLRARLPAEDRAMFVATVLKPVRAAALHQSLLQALDPAAAALHAVETAGGGRTGDGPAAGVSLRILLAEDNSVNQRVAQLLLRKLGHRVDTVGNGREAVDAVRRAAYDVVLMDVQMPVLDGLRATAEIRAEFPADRQPPIVGITAGVSAEDRAACAAAGMDAHLSKPVRLAELSAVLEGLHRRVAAQQ